ncbi:tetratricopeptide repeat protein [Brevundimonas sp. 2R-24]|uniref:Tetratricopeptide repeat protein n=1 Tax=Peiella sedimenti TaxID=3061083 RepID=A0ABT8SPU3_9CAUL|nr:tetratricopeptide repeat protein [Caulobacteraceae bacterium XZ-24]
MTARPAAADDLAPLAAQAGLAKGPMGDAGSGDAVARLKAAIQDLKAHAVTPLLHQAVAAMREARWADGTAAILKALEADETNGLAWHLLAICLEKSGDVASALDAYETALKLRPEEHGIANDLGRLAHRLGHNELAEKLFHHFLLREPGHVEAVNNLACALRDMDRQGEAIELLRTVIQARPEHPVLWNTLATVLSEKGDMEGSLPFFDEALRLDPGFAKARYNRANAILALGRSEEALAELEAALPGAQPGYETDMMRLARAFALLRVGRLKEGFDEYEVRFSKEALDTVHFATDLPRWSPDDDLTGKSLLVSAEQGLGDEVLFMNVIPDLLEALGPEGRLHLAVERRLVPLVQRSFPGVTVAAHKTLNVSGKVVRFLPWPDDQGFDLFTPIASLWRRFRSRPEAFPQRPAFLTAEPARVAHWKAQLDALGPGYKVGLLWKSLKTAGARSRHYSAFEQWRPVLETPGAVMVNLQYGDCSDELAQARKLGVDVWSPPGIDLKDDLDEVAALSCALDLVMGPANATQNIAAASGANVWMMASPEAWTVFGAENCPAYPVMRVFHAPTFREWDVVIGEMAAALRAEIG